MAMQQVLEQLAFETHGQGFTRLDPELNQWLTTAGINTGGSPPADPGRGASPAPSALTARQARRTASTWSEPASHWHPARPAANGLLARGRGPSDGNRRSARWR